MRALITGSSGFAASHLAERLLAEGDRVLGCARRDRWPEDAPDELRRTPLAVWDLSRDDGLDAESLRRIRDFAPQAIYHLAAISVPRACGVETPTELAWQTNVEGTRRVAELAGQLPERPRVLLASSSYVYAPPTQGPTQGPTRGMRVRENAPLRRGHAYGQTKQAAEQTLLETARRVGVEPVVARAFQHSGPRQDERMMLSEWASQFAAGRDPVAVHNLDTWLDVTDVRDVAIAYRLLVLCGRPGGVYNVGSGSRQRTGDIFLALRRLADPNRRYLELKPGRRQAAIANIDRLRHDTLWRPRIAIARTVADTYADWLGRLESRRRVAC